MSSTDLKSRFLDAYKGDIKDPILSTLLDAVDAYQDNVRSQHLLTAYSQRSDQIGDGFFEVLRRHLFGQMYPGPVFAVAQGALREAASARPLLLEKNNYLSVYDQEGGKVLFGPQFPSWIAPAQNNDVKIEAVGDDLILSVSLYLDNLSQTPEGVASIYAGEVDPLLIERIRCRLPKDEHPEGERRSPIRSSYPGKYTILDEFFHTPYEQRFLNIPFVAFSKFGKRAQGSNMVSLPLQGLGQFASQLERKLVLNAFTMWNMIEEEAAPIPIDNFRYTISISDHITRETVITSVKDFGVSPPIEYVDASTVMDPGYPYQYTTSGNVRRDEVILAFSPPPQGDIRVRYSQYDIGELCTNIASGRSFGLYQGIDEKIKSITTLTPTQRLNALNDKEFIWNYFRSMIASRNRTLTRDDLRAAVAMYPPFAGKRDLFDRERIRFEEQVGRVNGFLTPFTEIVIPVNNRIILTPVDRPYFERQIGLYLKSRTIHGNFLRVRLTSTDEL